MTKSQALTRSREADATQAAGGAAGAEPARKFYHLSVAERIEAIRAERGLDAEQVAALGRPDPLPLELADRMVENVIGVLTLPMGLARNFVIDGRAVSVPMATEEPSVVAAASHGAKLLAGGGGIRTSADAPRMVGQVLLTGVHGFEPAAARLAERRAEILAAADARHARLTAAGGGARGFELRMLDADPSGWTAVLELEVDVQDAMGANVVNSMCEAIAPLVAEATGGRVGMRILTNLCDRRKVRAEGVVPKAALGGPDGVEAVVLASRFAELDAYRACTHNKGIMNGIDAVLIACGQDWRAAEAGAHAFAAREGRYGPLAVWRRTDEGDLHGRIELPLAVGTVGSRARVHPAVEAALRILGVGGAAELARIAAATGLAQNLAAIRALAHEGIQQGHMALHHRVAPQGG